MFLNTINTCASVLPGNVSWRVLGEWTASRRCRSWRNARPSGWSSVSLVFAGAWQCSYSGDTSAYWGRFQALRLGETTQTDSQHFSHRFLRYKQFSMRSAKPADAVCLVRGRIFSIRVISSNCQFCNMWHAKSGFVWLRENNSVYKCQYVPSVSLWRNRKKNGKNMLWKCASCYGNHMPEAITVLV